MSSSPLISVILPAYNAQQYVEAAVSSVLAQTYQRLELIVIDDGSQDATPKLLEQFSDRRLRVLRQENGGLVRALNAGLGSARGDLIARMDADDISHPERLSSQLGFMRSTGVDIVASSVERIDASGKVIGSEGGAFVGNDALKGALIYRRAFPPIVHPSVLMRREVFDQLGLYRDFKSAEDRDLWLRAIDRYRFGRCSSKLLQYRVHPQSVSHVASNEQKLNSLLAAYNYLHKASTGIDPYAQDVECLTRARAILKPAAERLQRASRARKQIGQFLRREIGWREIVGLRPSELPLMLSAFHFAFASDALTVALTSCSEGRP